MNSMKKITAKKMRILGIILILLPMLGRLMTVPVSSGEGDILRAAAHAEESMVLAATSAADISVTGTAGTLTLDPAVLPQAPVVKRAYLTFDDGPSPNTDRILDILNLYGVKATFFVNNKEGAENILRYQRIVNEGHTIGLHSASHVYREVYKSAEDFIADYLANQAYIAQITGVTPIIYRFPGGSNNKVSKVDTSVFIDILNQNGIPYYDWNAYAGDAVKKIKPASKLAENALNGCTGKNDVMILMHDLTEKTTTVDALPAIIEGLIARGYVILPIDTSVPSTTPAFHFK